ncbi:hypothetical protein ABKN59_008971 [Abortiporus biennis]
MCLKRAVVWKFFTQTMILRPRLSKVLYLSMRTPPFTAFIVTSILNPAFPHIHLTKSKYASRTRRLINLITALRALGAQADFDLPRIAVIGNQSAGKSSLVEAISGINVPRASGTCTRCPMECRLTYALTEWKCQVLLRCETDQHGNVVHGREVKFGPVLQDKTELEEMLRRAQLAILNPSVQSSRFVDFDTSTLAHGELPLGSTSQLQFSSNVVCLDISGPDVTDLSFIDLPGIIQNVAPGEDRNNITAVRKMVEDHIKGDTLILLTITMRDDIDNQAAADLARKEDPQGLRTIGVLTKPDTLQHGEEHAWLRVLEGTSHILKHGYFVTKQPSPKELEEHVSFTDARKREAEYFQTQHPWKDKKNLESRMGTVNLTNELSKLLGGIINQSLPFLRQKSKDSLQEVKESMEHLPPPPSENPATELLRLITGFSAEVGSLVKGVESYERLLQNCRPAYSKFKLNIRRTAPDFRPFTSPTDPLISDDNGNHRVDIEEDGHEQSMSSYPLYINDVKAHIERSLTRELPYNVPFRVKASLIKNFTSEWDPYCQECFDTIYTATLEELKKSVECHFGQIKSSGLWFNVLSIVEEQVERAREKTQKRINWMLELEDPPFTLNDHYFSIYREKYLAKYKQARSPQDIASEAMSEAITALTRLGPLFEGLTMADLFKLPSISSHEEELIVMAETAAYFHVTYKRFIDNIPRIIDHDFLHRIQKEIQAALIGGLSVGSGDISERAAMYLAEDEQVARDRKVYKMKKERLEEVMKRLANFGM